MSRASPLLRGGVWTPTCPAGLATQRLALEECDPPGILAPDRHVDAAGLRPALEARGVVILDA